MNEQARIALPVLLPAIGLAAAAFLFAWQPWRRGEARPRGEWGAVVAFAAAYIAAILVQAGSRGLQLKESWHWQWIIAASAMTIGLIVAIRKPRAVGKSIAIFSAAISAAILFHPPASADNPILWKGILGGLVLMNVVALEPIALRRTGALLPLCVMIVFGCLSIVLLESHFANFSLMAAACSAAAGVAFVLALMNPRGSLANGSVIVIATALSLLLVTGWVYGKPASRLPLILIQCSVLAIWLGELLPATRRPLIAVLVRAAIVAAIGAAAVAIMVRSSAQEESVDDDYADYYSLNR